MSPARSRAAGALLVLLAAAPAAAQPTLSWRELAVAARLDAEGRLHVRERHAMVFDGEWNGGERIFRLDRDHDLELVRISREVPSVGGTRLVPLAEGDLDRFDHYAWTDSSTLRWRSRLPSDPPFVAQEIPYVLEYVLSGVLIPRERDYLWRSKTRRTKA